LNIYASLAAKQKAVRRGYLQSHCFPNEVADERPGLQATPLNL
jgi:hypothetical protein